MKSSLVICVLVSGFLVSPAALAGSGQINCPAKIPETSMRVTHAPQPWKPYVLSPLYLSSAVATAGPPELRAVLTGDSTWRRGLTEWTTTYNLRDGGFPNGKWMECRYGELGQISLSIRLHDQTQACTLRFGKGENAGQRSIKIFCK
jgi:hypothetical protein